MKLLPIVLVLVLLPGVVVAGQTPESYLKRPVTGEYEPEPTRGVKWAQYPLIGGDAYASQYDTTYPFYAECADDFYCSDGSPITFVEWCGIYWNGVWPPYAQGFVIRFYDNVPGPPSCPGQLLYEDSCYAFVEEWGPYIEQYHYYQFLDEPFQQEVGNTY